MADTRNHRIQVIDSQGKFVHMFGTPQFLSAPSVVRVRDDGRIFVCDKEGVTVW